MQFFEVFVKDALVHDPSLLELHLKKAQLEGEESLRAPLKNWTFCKMGNAWNLFHQRTGHALHNPDEIAQWVKQLDISSFDLLTMYGLGLGEYYQALIPWLREKEQRRVLFIEDDPELLHAFFETSAASAFLDDPQVILLYKKDLGSFIKRLLPLFKDLHFLRRKFASSIDHLRNQPSETAFIEYYLTFFFKLAKMGEQEMFEMGKTYFPQLFRNFMRLSESKPGIFFKDRFKQVPAVICGAGPSLGKQKELLQQLKKRALIFAGGSAMNALTAMGIMPHFGAGIDPFEPQFSRILENDAWMIPYFYTHRMHAGSVSALLGETLFIPGDHNYPISDWMDQKVGVEIGEKIDLGLNVTQATLAFAKMMGCNPVIFVGLDLAFTDGKIYAPGIHVHGTFEQQESFIEIPESQERIVIQDIFGNPTRTVTKWLHESAWYKQFTKKNPSMRLINCTEGGIGLMGVPNQKLQEVMGHLTEIPDLQRKVDEALAQVQEQSYPSFQETLHVQQQVYNEFQEALDKDGSDKESVKTLLEPFLKLYEAETEDLVSLRQSALPPIKDLRTQVLKGAAFYAKSGIDEAKLENNALSIRCNGTPLDGSSEGAERVLFSNGAIYALKSRETHRYFYRDGILRAFIRFKDGLLEGAAQLYYPNGRLKREVHYVGGMRNGFDRYFHPNGQVLREVLYEKSMPTGVAKVWNPEGVVQKEIYYRLPNVIEKTIHYDAQGKLADYYNEAIAKSEKMSRLIAQLAQAVKLALPGHFNMHSRILVLQDIVSGLVSDAYQKDAGLDQTIQILNNMEGPLSQELLMIQKELVEQIQRLKK